MNDIDKDIEILKEIQGIFEHFKNHGWVNDLKREVDIDKVIPAIENVLEELEKKDKIIDLMSRAILNYDDQLVINKYRNKEEVKEYFEENYEELMKIYGK